MESEGTNIKLRNLTLQSFLTNMMPWPG